MAQIKTRKPARVVEPIKIPTQAPVQTPVTVEEPIKVPA